MNNYIGDYIYQLSYGIGGDIGPLVSIARIQFAINDQTGYEKTLKKIYKLFSPVKEDSKKGKKGYFKVLDNVFYYESGLIEDKNSGAELCANSWQAQKRIQSINSKKSKDNPKGLTSLRWDRCISSIRTYMNRNGAEIVSKHVFPTSAYECSSDKRSTYEDDKIVIDLSYICLIGFNNIEKTIQKNTKVDRWAENSLHKTEISPFLRWTLARDLLPEDQKHILAYKDYFSNKNDYKNYESNLNKLISKIVSNFKINRFDSINYKKNLEFRYISYEDCKTLYSIFKKYTGKRYDSSAIDIVYNEIIEKQREVLKTMSYKVISFYSENSIFGTRSYSYIGHDKNPINYFDLSVARLRTISKTLCEASKSEPDLHQILSTLEYIDDTLVFPEEETKAEIDNTEPQGK